VGEVWLSSSFGASAVSVGSAGKSVPVWYSATPSGGAQLPATVRATIDTSASRALLVELGQPSPGCHPSGKTIVCERTPDGRFVQNGDLRLRLAPAPGAAVGDQAEITITVTAPGAETNVQTFDLTLSAAGPDLQVDSSDQTLAPGGTTSTRPSIRNSGSQAAPTVLVSLYSGSYTRFPVHYRNCHYRTDDYGFEDGVCLLNNIHLAPGETLTPSRYTPLPIQVKSNVPGQYRPTRYDPPGQPYSTYLSYSVDAFDAAPVDERLSWPLGNGPTLKWQRTTTAAVATLAAEADPRDNYGQIAITVSPNNPTDIAAKGTAVTGRVGDIVSATVGIRNNGPAAVSATPELKGGDPADPYNAGLRFTPPKNTEVTEVVLPPGYYYQDWYEQTTSAGKTYLVLPYSLAHGAEYQVQFKLRITAAGTGQGTVVGQGGTSDPVSTNNTSPVSVSSS
jgi:hypothetical protein